MILICDFCKHIRSNIFRIPAAFLEGNLLIFPIRSEEGNTVDICLNCLQQKGESENV
jgi:hypothetical protein